MIHLIYGLPGSGKTTLIKKNIMADVEAGKKAFLIVPEQQTVEVERAMARALPPSAMLCFEVLNFSRLANKLFRIYGGLSYHYITPGMKKLLMWQTLRTLSPFLGEYAGRSDDPSLPSALLAAVGELKMNGISPLQLENATKQMDNENALAKKMRDLSLIYSMYESMVRESYDDSSDDLLKLAELLEKHVFFKDCHVYIDSFTDFTAQEYRILKCIASQSDRLTVTLLAPSPDCTDMYLSSVLESSKKLRLLAEGREELTVLPALPRYKSESLSALAHDLWHFHVKDKCPEEGEKNPITVIHCTTAYEEAEAAVGTVLSLVQNGCRYRDIAIVARDADSYRGILDTALGRADIPHFMSEKADIATKPLVAFLFSALAIHSRSYRREDVMGYLKTGLSEFSLAEIDAFESYTSTWSVRGKGFTTPFTMNPDGYQEEMSARAESILETAESVRLRLADSLSAFFEMLDHAETMQEHCEAVYIFLQKQKVAERLSLYAERAFAEGDKKEAAETATLFQNLFSVLSDLIAAMGEESVSHDEFVTALRLVLSETTLGTIPTAADEVMIGSASMLRAGGIRHAILLGLCEGEFPMRVGDRGLFSDSDRSALEEFGIKVEGNSKSDAAKELFYAYRAMTMPSESLFLVYRDKPISGSGSTAPSLALRRVCELLPHTPVIQFSALPLSARIYDRESALDALKRQKNKEGIDSIEAVLRQAPDFSARIDAARRPVTAGRCRLEDGTLSELFGDHMTLTQSGMEKYVSCHFSYYCRYVLRLREDKKAGFDYSNIGVFIHKILEVFLKTTGKDSIDADRDIELIRSIIREEIRKQSQLMIPKDKQTEGRIVHLLLRFYRLAGLVAVNICRERGDSLFLSRLYEAEFGPHSRHSLAAPTLTLADGSKIELCGKVDRIDSYRKNGKVYVRVVDYKTGAKSFSLDDIREGYSLQLLLYLFAVCDSRSDYFRSLLGCEKGDVLTPAGAIYLSMHVPSLTKKPSDSDESVLKAASDELKRSGLLLDDPDALRAMSGSLDPKMLAGIKPSKKDGSLSGKALTSAETFDMLKVELADTIKRIASEMRAGNADACPDNHGGISACQYCNMKAVCRINKRLIRKDESEVTL